MSPSRAADDASRGGASPEVTGHRLACGRSGDDVLEQVALGRGDQRDAHQARCVHCQAALTEAGRLWAPVASLAAREEIPPPDLLQRVMRAIRELARERRHLTLPGDRGTTRVSADAVARIAQRTAEEVEGVRVAFSQSRAGRLRSSDAVGIAGQHVVVDLAVVTTYGRSIPAVADRARAAVHAALTTLAGATTVEVNIYVDDVLPAASPGSAPGRR